MAVTFLFLLGAVGISDRIRPEMGHMVQKLRKGGVRRIIMLTGDDPEAAEAVAGEAAIYQCGVSPTHARLRR